MKDTIWVKLVLALSGSVGVGIGLSILVWPRAFYASSGIALGENVSLLSEIRAPAVVLVVFGLGMLGALIARRFQKEALIAAAVLYLSYGTGRVISIVLDGVPHFNMVAAMGIEIGIGLLCVFVLWGWRDPINVVSPA